MKKIVFVIIMCGILGGCANSGKDQSSFYASSEEAVSSNTDVDISSSLDLSKNETLVEKVTDVPKETTAETETLTTLSDDAVEPAKERHLFYILNHNSNIVHDVDCHTLEDKSEDYELLMDIGMDMMNDRGYSSCDVCKPYIPETSGNRAFVGTTVTKSVEFDRTYIPFTHNEEIRLITDTELYYAPDEKSDQLYRFDKGTVLVAVGSINGWYAVLMNGEIEFCEKSNAEPNIYTTFDYIETETQYTEPEPQPTEPPQTTVLD